MTEPKSVTRRELDAAPGNQKFLYGVRTTAQAAIIAAKNKADYYYYDKRMCRLYWKSGSRIAHMPEAPTVKMTAKQEELPDETDVI